MAGFDQAEQQTFSQQGFLLKRGLYAEPELTPLRNAITAALDAECDALIATGAMQEVQACRAEPFSTRLGRVVHALDDESLAQRRVLAAMQDLFLAGRVEHAGIANDAIPVADALLGCIRHEPVLDCVSSLVGNDIIGSSTFRIRGKIPLWDKGRTKPYFPGEVPWHQDAGYMLPHCDQHLIVTCWVPLVDATIENGCMYVYPWRFEQSVLPHYFGRKDHYIWIPEDLLPEADPVPVEMRAGDVLFLTNMTPHATFDNVSSTTRWSMDLRYAPIGVPNNVDEAPESYTPERTPNSMACAPTEADFVIRDTANPERDVVDGGAFAEIRMRYARQHVHPGRGWTHIRERRQ
ncbi:MAG: hypothetical protein CMQ29_11705 [Gammaproteobacteria bacterium]|nr:hypothetical protein [Gammaproteobacteria bacterium]